MKKTTQPALVISRLEKAFLATGLLNERFLEMIETGEVDEDYARQAFLNFQKAMHPGKPTVEKSYVLGFMFGLQEESVLLVQKARPAWQAGRLNGIGGHIEAGETPLQAMEREFGEETNFKALVNAAGDEIRPEWKYVGRRTREAITDNQPGSYEMHIFACHFDAETCLRDQGGNSKFHAGYKSTWLSEDFTTDEPVMYVPLQTEFLNDCGVNGLPWLLDAARHALRENFFLTIKDPANMTEEVAPE